MFYRTSENSCPAGSVPYIVRERDTLGNIAFFYNTSVQDILLANPGINPNLLQIGQQICVPLRPQMYPSCPTTNYYVVVKGDTLQSIASSFQITAQQLLYANYGINPDLIYEDQVLCIPVAASPVHIVVDVSKHQLMVYRSKNVYKTYTIDLEDPSEPIPKGAFQIVNKQVDADSDRGARWLGLSAPGFGIQGTSYSQFIDNISDGHNIVLSNKDVCELFNLAPVGTAVEII